MFALTDQKLSISYKTSKLLLFGQTFLPEIVEDKRFAFGQLTIALVFLFFGQLAAQPAGQRAALPAGQPPMTY